MITRWLTPLVWMLVAGCSAFWGLQLFARPVMAPPDARVPALPTVPLNDGSKVLGDSVKEATEEDSATAAESDRFELLGIIAQPARGEARSGLALLRVDSGLARTWHTGETVAEGWVLQAIQKRSVVLRQAETEETLEIALPDPSNTPSTATTSQAGRRPPSRIVGTTPPTQAGGRPTMPPRQRTAPPPSEEEEESPEDDEA